MTANIGIQADSDVLLLGCKYLATPATPEMGPWLHVMEVAFVLFLLALFALVWRGGERGGGFKRGAWKWALLAALAFGAWAWALSAVPRP